MAADQKMQKHSTISGLCTKRPWRGSGLFSGDEVVQMAADQIKAQCSLGSMYGNGEAWLRITSGVRAIRWYRMVADQGHGAQYNLGICTHDNGKGVAQDYSAR